MPKAHRKGERPTVPDNHLLSTTGALGLIVSAEDGGLRSSDLLGGRRAGDMAPEVLHVHVGLAACRIRNRN